MVAGVMICVSFKELLPQAWCLSAALAVSGLAVGSLAMLATLAMLGDEGHS